MAEGQKSNQAARKWMEQGGEPQIISSLEGVKCVLGYYDDIRSGTLDSPRGGRNSDGVLTLMNRAIKKRQKLEHRQYRSVRQEVGR